MSEYCEIFYARVHTPAVADASQDAIEVQRRIEDPTLVEQDKMFSRHELGILETDQEGHDRIWIMLARRWSDSIALSRSYAIRIITYMPQTLHPDFETTLPDTDYFVLGSGSIQAAIQWSRHPGATPLGLVLSDPGHFARKWSSHLFHPEYGLGKTMLTLILNGKRYQPDETTQVVWFPGEIPGVTALWQAGHSFVIERFWTSIDEPVLIREITFESERQLETAEVEIALYGNPALFSEFLGSSYGLSARGYDTMLVSSHAEGTFHERTLTVPLYRDGSVYRMAMMYSLGPDMPSVPLSQLKEMEESYWMMAQARWTEQHPSPLLHEVERLFTASAMGLRAAVADSGRFDASIWQYGYEWSGDASNVAEALVYSGQFEVGAACSRKYSDANDHSRRNGNGIRPLSRRAGCRAK